MNENRNPYQLGEDIEVRVWWLKDQVKKCRVIERSNPDHTNGDIYVTVILLIDGQVPYGHSRWVNMTKDGPQSKRGEAMTYSIVVIVLLLFRIAYVCSHPMCPSCKIGRGYQHGLWPNEICDWCGHEWDSFNDP